MGDSRLAVRYQGAGAVQRTREQLEWVEEDDLLLLQDKEPAAAGLLSLFTGGGGQLYVGDYRAGAGLTAAGLGTFVCAVAVTPIAWLPLLGLGVASGIGAWRKARAINRYLAARRAHADVAAPHPPGYRLLAAMSAREPGPGHSGPAPSMPATPGVPGPSTPAPAGPPLPAAHQEAIDRLRKLAAIRAAGAIAEHEHRARKVDILSKVCDDLERDALDDLLYALLPLLQEGAIEDEDIDLVKQLGGELARS